MSDHITSLLKTSSAYLALFQSKFSCQQVTQSSPGLPWTSFPTSLPHSLVSICISFLSVLRCTSHASASSILSLCLQCSFPKLPMWLLFLQPENIHSGATSQGCIPWWPHLTSQILNTAVPLSKVPLLYGTYYSLTYDLILSLHENRSSTRGRSFDSFVYGYITSAYKSAW
jgi:hypothetical protein